MTRMMRTFGNSRERVGQLIVWRKVLARLALETVAEPAAG